MTNSEDIENESSGKRFMVVMAVLFLLTVAAYVVLHICYPAECTRQPPAKMIRIDKFGFATVISAEDLAWQVGDKKAVPLVAVLNARNERIVALRSQLDAQLLKAETELLGVLRGEAYPFSCLLTRIVEECEEHTVLPSLAKKISSVAGSLSIGTLLDGRAESLRALGTTVNQLSQLRSDQIMTRGDAKPPRKYMVFWMSPYGVLFEALFWSLFGTLTSLVFHSARALTVKNFAKDGFKPIERWVGFSKIIYGPIVTAVLVFALWLGLIEFGGPELRSWSLPLIGVLIGFNVRKAVDIVDELSRGMLDRFRKSSLRSDAERQAAEDAKFRGLTITTLPYLPKTLTELKAAAKVAVDPVIIDAVKKEMRSQKFP
jgi:hypothetical protein